MWIRRKEIVDISVQCASTIAILTFCLFQNIYCWLFFSKTSSVVAQFLLISWNQFSNRKEWKLNLSKQAKVNIQNIPRHLIIEHVVEHKQQLYQASVCDVKQHRYRESFVQTRITLPTGIGSWRRCPWWCEALRVAVHPHVSDCCRHPCHEHKMCTYVQKSASSRRSSLTSTFSSTAPEWARGLHLHGLQHRRRLLPAACPCRPEDEDARPRPRIQQTEVVDMLRVDVCEPLVDSKAKRLFLVLCRVSAGFRGKGWGWDQRLKRIRWIQQL
jgi:hypothetical protein